MNQAMNRMRRAAAVVIAIASVERALAGQQPAAAPAPAKPVTRTIVVNLPAMNLDLIENGKVIKSYRIAVGKRATQTPVGTFRIASMVKNPAWNGSHGQKADPGPRNPVGTRWMGLDAKGYGIHGTNAPGSIGRAASHGCIRLRNADAEDLFERVRVGDEVQITYKTVTADGTQYSDVYNRAAVSADAGGGS